MARRVCPFCKETNYVCVESFPIYKVVSFYVSGEYAPTCEEDDENIVYDDAKPPVVFCPECETPYPNCSSVEEAWKQMLLTDDYEDEEEE